jgi:hypothetical protein
MMRRVTFAASLWFASLAGSLACDFDPSSQPWPSRVDDAPLVFIGHVTAVKPSTKPGDFLDRVFFSVDTPVSGQPGPTYETKQGGDGDCGLWFEVGDWVIFAGSKAFDPTVFLSDPLTRDQKMKLGHLKKMLAKAAHGTEGSSSPRGERVDRPRRVRGSPGPKGRKMNNTTNRTEP